MSHRFLMLFVLLTAAALAMGGVGSMLVPRTPDDSSLLPSFSSPSDLKEFLDSKTASSTNYESDKGAIPTTAVADSAPRHSETNLQVKGVDEADIVKTDGHYLYAASYDSVSIIKAYPPNELGNVSVINCTELAGKAATGSISGMFLTPGRLMIIYSVYDYSTNKSSGEVGPMAMDDPSPYLPWGVGQERTMVAVFDVSDPADPQLLSSSGVSGYSVTSRMIADRVYLVAQDYIWRMGSAYSTPAVWNNGTNSTVDFHDIHYDPMSPDAFSFVNLFALNITTGECKAVSIIAGYSSVVYMSPSSLYLTFQKWTGSDAGSGPEFVSAVRTTIYRISVDGLDLTMASRGDVEGWLINQYSMDESEGYLRVATTTSWTGAQNDVFVLDPQLKVTGAVKGLATGERIYSCRFVNDRLYMVTFYQVDPLFVVDLSNPTGPKVLGELKIPGVSTYLQMVDGMLLGIGFEDSGVKVSLFDVTDATKPKEISTYRVDGLSYSIAQYDPKAVLWDEDNHLLTIPVSVYSPVVIYTPALGYYALPTSQAYVFHLSSSGIELRGTVTHDGSDVQRSLYIGDYLYTVSGTTIKANHLPDLVEAGSLVFHDYERYYGYAMPMAL